MAERENLLTPEEMVALAADAGDGTAEGYNLGAQVRRHDLAGEDSSLGVNLASVDMINERFIRLFRLGMLEVLRTSPRINPARVRIMRFGEYLAELRPPLSVNVVRLSALRGYSMVVMEPNVVLNALDTFFGGDGKGAVTLPPGRTFTPTETRISQMILDVFFRSMREAWSSLMAMDFEFVTAEINPQFAQIADESDLVVLSRFESEAPAANAAAATASGPRGFIDLVMPYTSLKPVRDLLRSRVQTGDGHEASDKQWREELFDAMAESELTLRVELGRLQMTLDRLEHMAPGDVLPLRAFDHARVWVGAVPGFEGQVGTLGSQVAVQILAPITPVATAPVAS
jgi:flagellar motor switch protein FliM